MMKETFYAILLSLLAGSEKNVFETKIYRYSHDFPESFWHLFHYLTAHYNDSFIGIHIAYNYALNVI